MALTGAEIVDEIREIVGRPGSSDMGVITDVRVTRWVNEGQSEIVEQCIGLHSMSFKNTTSLDTTVTLAYDFSDITVGDSSTGERVCRIYDVYYLDGNESVKLDFMFTDDFDSKYPDPTHTDVAKTEPTHWTRRKNAIEMFPLCLTANCNKDLRFDGDYYAADFTTNDSTAGDISGADQILIAYGSWKAWGAIGGKEATREEIKWKLKYTERLDDFRAMNDDLDEWDGNIYVNEIY